MTTYYGKKTKIKSRFTEYNGVHFLVASLPQLATVFSYDFTKFFAAKDIVVLYHSLIPKVPELYEKQDFG